MPKRPSKNTANKLWGSCGNECANPNCSAEVLSVDNTTKVVKKTGEIAHIKGANPGSNRHDAKQSDEERHSFDNLLILCSKCHTQQPDGVDVPANELRFPTKLLTEWKYSHLEKVQKLSDRNWIYHPNSAIELQNGKSISTEYWIDREGKPQLYTAEQLAVVKQLFPLVSSFSQINSMMDTIKETEGKAIDQSHQTMNDAVIGRLYRDLGNIAQVNEYGWIGYLADSLLIAQDVTLGELYSMMVADGLKDKKENMERGVKLLKIKAHDHDPLPMVTTFESKE